MELTLDYYSTYGPSGKIYVRCLGELEHCRIDYPVHAYRVKGEWSFGIFIT